MVAGWQRERAPGKGGAHQSCRAGTLQLALRRGVLQSSCEGKAVTATIDVPPVMKFRKRFLASCVTREGQSRDGREVVGHQALCSLSRSISTSGVSTGGRLHISVKLKRRNGSESTRGFWRRGEARLTSPYSDVILTSWFFLFDEPHPRILTSAHKEHSQPPEQALE